jgi:nucleotide-binding universal stress UspA family protein
MIETDAVVVAGTDGSPGARPAIAWAAAEARRRQGTLLLVHAYQGLWIKDAHLPPPGLLDVAVNHAEEILANAALVAHMTAPGVAVRRVAALGDPVPTLLRHAESAELVVVGSHGHGGFASMLIGSVGMGVTTRAACPSVVVRGHSGHLDGPVVVGVDDCAASCHAIEMAFDYAAAYGCDLVAVRAFDRPVPEWGADISPSVLRLEEQLGAERRILADLVEPWQDKYPEVRVEPVVSRRAAAAVLVESSAAARLAVVGSHGHGAVAGALLGSVGLQLLHHAGCPVLIARG